MVRPVRCSPGPIPTLTWPSPASMNRTVSGVHQPFGGASCWSGPGAVAGHSFDRDPYDAARGRLVHRWELDARAKESRCQFLQ